MASVKQAVIKNTRQLALANKDAATVIALGEILALDGGLAVPADSSTTRAELLGVSNAAISAGDALTQVPYIVPSDEDTYIFSTTNNTDPLDNGQLMVLGADSTTVNNTGTTDADGIVQQIQPYGAAADKLIIGRFITV